MMLFIGGAYQGKKEYMKQITGWNGEEITDGGADTAYGAVIDHYHERIRRQLQQGLDPLQELERLLQVQPDVILLCDEVGLGIVPMEKGEREYREAVGRVMCAAAEKASAVYRVVCGLGQRIK